MKSTKPVNRPEVVPGIVKIVPFLPGLVAGRKHQSPHYPDPSVEGAGPTV